MTETRNVAVGTINGGATTIYANVLSIGSAVPVKVTLSTNYAMLDPVGFPSRPSFTGAADASLQYPRTILSGTTLSLLACEAAALVTAGAATYA